MIDSHVHCRDWFQWQKETIAHALTIAEINGFDAIFDQSNSDPAIDSKSIARLRLLKAKEAYSNVIYGLFLGLTSNPSQIQEMIDTHEEYSLRNEKTIGTVGFKMFAGKSIGDLTVSKINEQKIVYKTLVNKLKYPAVLDVHCENEDKMKLELWEPSNPITHSYARPEICETSSVAIQIELCLETGYAVKGTPGKLHLVHLSTSQSVDLVHKAKDKLNITCATTPEHLLIDNSAMNQIDGIALKMNPPLRSPQTREGLFQSFLDNKIDVLESDHAPHTSYEKFQSPYMSGVHTLPYWPIYLEELVKRRAPKDLIDRMMYDNVNKIFETNIKTIEERELKRLKLENKFGKDNAEMGDFYSFNPIQYISKALLR